MSVTALRLEDASGAVLDLDPASGYTVNRLDIGFPVVRGVTESRPDDDGETDTTLHFGAAAVSIDLQLFPNTQTLVELRDALRAFCHPAARPWLYVEQDGQQRRIRLRADQQTAPLTDPFHQQVQASWRAPDGVLESAAEQIGTATATADSVAGRTYDKVFPVSYAETSPVGSVAVANEGNVPVAPLLRLYGPATNPRVENQTTGERLVFTDLIIAAGDWLEIDCRAKTARLNGMSTQSRLANLAFTTSAFFKLLPGPNTVRYYPTAFGDGARLEVRFRSAWL